MTATRLADDPSEQPYAFYPQDRETLDEANGRTLTDSFSYAPGVFIQHTAPNQASPFIRGLTGERALLLFDGVRLNHAMMRPGPNQYAAMIADESVGAVDLILGSSSAVTGSDGLTGAIDFRLAPPGRGVNRPASAFVKTRLSSAEGVSAAAGVDGVRGGWAYTVEAGFASYHDLVGGKDAGSRVFDDRFSTSPGNPVDGRNFAEIPNTASDQFSVAARVAYAGLENNRFEFAAGQTTMRDAPRPDGYFENSGQPGRISRFFDPQQFNYIHLRHVLTPESAVRPRVQSTVWFHQHHEVQFREEFQDFGDPLNERYRRREFDDTIDSVGLDVQATSFLSEKHELSYGLTYLTESTANEYREFRSPRGDLDPADAVPHKPNEWATKSTVPDGSKYDSLGVFVQDSWRLSEQWRVLAGVRFSRFAWDSDAKAIDPGTGGVITVPADNSTGDITGNLRIAWKPQPGQIVFLGLSQGFRAPNLTNLVGKDERASSGFVFQGNPGLDPEKSRTVEVGWRYTAGRNKLAISLFNTAVDELIQRVEADLDGDGNLEGFFANAEGAVLYGGEVQVDWAIPTGEILPTGSRLSFALTASTVRAQVDVPQSGGGVQEEFISRANRLFGRTGLKYEGAGRRWWGLAQVRWSDAYEDVAPRDATDVRMTVAGDAAGRMPGFGVVDIKTGWRSKDGNRALTLAGENLFAKTYRDPGSGTDGPGINFIISAMTRF